MSKAIFRGRRSFCFIVKLNSERISKTKNVHGPLRNLGKGKQGLHTLICSDWDGIIQCSKTLGNKGLLRCPKSGIKVRLTSHDKSEIETTVSGSRLRHSISIPLDQHSKTSGLLLWVVNNYSNIPIDKIQRFRCLKMSDNFLRNLLLDATTLYELAEADPRISVLSQAIQAATMAKAHSDWNSEPHSFSVELLLKLYVLKHKAWGERSDLEMAIQYARECTSFDHTPTQIAVLQSLSILQVDLFDETRELGTAKSAFSTAQRAVELAQSYGRNNQAECEANGAGVLYRLCQEKAEVYGANQLDHTSV